jgi:3-deoxy-D-manno-octulosonate 8-phosphate phosphatase (KDO 8-P phosphatase)
MTNEVVSKFRQMGGTFLASENEIAQKLLQINAFIFDLDGVFNNGIKSFERGSVFSEADSMGINMLRFCYWRIQGKVPFVFIITGENNKSAIDLAEREHFNAVYSRFGNKKLAMEQISEKYQLSFDRMMFVMDDILDINAGNLCGLSFCVNREASALFKDFVIKYKTCHYITANDGGNHAIREISELLMGLLGEYETTIMKRIEYSEEYTRYLLIRNEIITESKTVAV